MAILLTKLKYDEHGWKICVDIKVLNMLQGQQSKYTKFLFLFCKWDSRDKAEHWIKRNRSRRMSRTPGHENISNYAHVDF